ncbi:alpha/beta hydrolase [Loigolactobacillus jiayinensis]|uniref:Alpha/beta hydrolase n=1 Tax=Loigolactobacillus jiayinensis TaxID=2486016 RepID=A0ABW1R919_9LACO|nr:alpha/beta hydrolase [Loigolactobacillus jiayinensis]
MEFKQVKLQTPQGLNFTIKVYVRQQFTAFPDTRAWPIVLLFPGGGFAGISEREEELAALPFLAKGYQAIVVRYNLITTGPFYPNAALIGLTTINYVRQNAAALHADPNKIVTAGFSAGGHLVAVMNALGNEPAFLAAHQFKETRIQPAAQILSYPVIDLTMGFPQDQAVAQQISSDQRLWHAQKLVTAQTPPTFIWHTVTDELVPVANTAAYLTALIANKVPFENHIYAQGVHGLAFSNVATSRYTHPEDVEPQAASWFPLVINWLAARFKSANQTVI